MSCRFKGRFGNMFESFGQPHSFWTTQKGGHVFIMDCRFFLNKDNAGYDQVDIQLYLSNNGESTFKLQKWGIRVFKDYSLAEKGLGDQNIIPRVCEPEEENVVYGICHETEQGKECEDDFVETKRCRKRMRVSIKHELKLNNIDHNLFSGPIHDTIYIIIAHSIVFADYMKHLSSNTEHRIIIIKNLYNIFCHSDQRVTSIFCALIRWLPISFCFLIFDSFCVYKKLLTLVSKIM